MSRLELPRRNLRTWCPVCYSVTPFVCPRGHVPFADRSLIRRTLTGQSICPTSTRVERDPRASEVSPTAFFQNHWRYRMNQVNDPQNTAYHHAFSSWLSVCSSEDADRLDALQAQHPSNEVRPMKSFIRECLNDPVLRDQLPQSLVAQLQRANWLPAQPCGAAA